MSHDLDDCPPWQGGRSVSRLALPALALVVAAGLALRCHGLSERSLWYDEAFSWRLTTFPWGEMVGRSMGDAHPPLYYVLLKAWCLVFGTSVPAMRALSVVLGGVTLIATFGFCAGAGARAPGGPRGLALFAAALVAVSAFQAHWAWEVRMYTLGTALLALSSWALFVAVGASSRRRTKWAAYGFVTLLFAYTHYYALFSIAAQLLFLLGYGLAARRPAAGAGGGRARLGGGAVALSVVALGWLPWLPVFLRQRGQLLADFWLKPESWGSQVLDACYRMFLYADTGGHVAPAWAWSALAACLAGLAFLAWRATAAERYVVAMAGAPVALAALAAASGGGVVYFRYLLFAHLFLLVALAMIVWRVRVLAVRGVLAGLLLFNGLVIYAGFVQALDLGRRGGARAATEYVNGNRRAGESVVVCFPQFYLSVLYYSTDPGAVRLYNGGHDIASYEGASVIRAEEIVGPEQLGAIRQGTVWVLDTGGWRRFPVSLPENWEEVTTRQFVEVRGEGGVILATQYRVLPPGANAGASPRAAAPAEPGAAGPGPPFRGCAAAAPRGLSMETLR